MDLSALPLKRIAIICSILLLIAGVIFALWAVKWIPVAQNPNSGDVDTPLRTPQQPVGGLGAKNLPTGSGIPATSTPPVAPAAPGPEQVFFSSLTISLANDPTGGMVAFNPSTSTFIHIDSNGNASNKSEERFFDVKGITWSHDRGMAVIEDANGKSIYNFNTKERIALPSNWEEFSFSPDNRSIAFKNLGKNSNSQWLATTNLTTGKINLITQLGNEANRVHVDWAPGNTALGFITIPTDGNAQQLSFINPDGAFASSTPIEGAFFRSRWAESGKLFVFSTADVDNALTPRLWVGLGSGEHRGAYQELSLTTTADQCTFGGLNDRLLICAVPDARDAASYGLLGDIPLVPHRIVALDLATGIPKTIYTPTTPTTIKSPVIAKDAKKIYFTNVTTGQVETVPLPQ